MGNFSLLAAGLVAKCVDRKLQQGTFESLCMEMRVKGEDIEMVSERTAPPKLVRLGVWESEEMATTTNPQAQKVADIGREIIGAARKYVRQRLDEAVEKAKAELKDKKLDRLELARKLNEDTAIKF
jgi:hypothetical protein